MAWDKSGQLYHLLEDSRLGFHYYYRVSDLALVYINEYHANDYDDQLYLYEIPNGFVASSFTDADFVVSRSAAGESSF